MLLRLRLHEMALQAGHDRLRLGKRQSQRRRRAAGRGAAADVHLKHLTGTSCPRQLHHDPPLHPASPISVIRRVSLPPAAKVPPTFQTVSSPDLERVGSSAPIASGCHAMTSRSANSSSFWSSGQRQTLLIVGSGTCPSQGIATLFDLALDRQVVEADEMTAIQRAPLARGCFGSRLPSLRPKRFEPSPPTLAAGPGTSAITRLKRPSG